MDHKISTAPTDSKGFTLIELAIVMLITGTTMITVTRFVHLANVRAQHEMTIENSETSQTAIEEFLGLEGVYPCPADPTLTPADALYGRSQCRDFANAAFDPDSCVGVPGNVSCTTSDSRDGDGNGSSDVVMIGIVPFRDIIDRLRAQDEKVRSTPYSEFSRLDGYGMSIAYAVTEHMTNTNIHGLTNPINPNSGAILVQDENRIPLTDPPGRVHFVVYSHGENGRGGYSASGVQAKDCRVTVLPPIPPIPPVPAPAPINTPAGQSPAGIKVEIENCDSNDAIFAKAIRSSADNASFNDDTLFFTTKGLRSLWKRKIGSQNYIYNTNLGNVGIGTNFPSHKLHIVGDLSAEVKVLGQRYCEGPTNSDCVDPIKIAGTTGSVCPTGEAAYALGYDPSDPDPLNDSTEIHCKPIVWNMKNLSCLPHDFGSGVQNTYLTGMSNKGNIICCRESPVVAQNSCIKIDGTTVVEL